MTIFNINEEDIEPFTTIKKNKSLIVFIKPKSSVQYCPNCNSKMIGNGIINKPVNHQFLFENTLSLFTKQEDIVVECVVTLL